jgi:hypothetical protein
MRYKRKSRYFTGNGKKDGTNIDIFFYIVQIYEFFLSLIRKIIVHTT